jgi:NifB/MoaA-like Fe-S oxidoreductase
MSPHTVQEFEAIVHDVAARYKFRVTGTPLGDPKTGSPFAIRHHPKMLKKLPAVTKEATLITGSIAAPMLRNLREARRHRERGAGEKIACLMTIDDVRALDLKDVKDTVLFTAGPSSGTGRWKRPSPQTVSTGWCAVDQTG